MHTIRISLAVGSDHIEAPFAADANIDRLRLDLEPGRTEPLGKMARISPGGVNQLSWRVDHAREDYLSIERPSGQGRFILTCVCGHWPSPLFSVSQHTFPVDQVVAPRSPFEPPTKPRRLRELPSAMSKS